MLKFSKKKILKENNNLRRKMKHLLEYSSCCAELYFSKLINYSAGDLPNLLLVYGRFLPDPGPQCQQTVSTKSTTR